MYAIIIFFLLVSIIIIFLYEKKRKKDKVRKWIREHYGKKSLKTNYPFEQVGIYWTEFGKEILDDETIDEVTWNDMEMNNIFSSICNCSSFVGEQMLYEKLHYLSKDEMHSKKLERKIDYFSTHQKEREEMQFLLNILGKEDVNYYLPMFINNLDVLGMDGIWIYRLMQILLGASIGLAFIFRNSVTFTVVVGIFLINLLIYAVNKMKHETYLASLGGVIALVKVGNKMVFNCQFYSEEEQHNFDENLKLFAKLAHVVGTIQKKRDATLSGDGLAIFIEYCIGATLWDFTKYNQIIGYLHGKQEQFMEIYKTIGEIDMAISISSFRKSLSFYCLPQFCTEKIVSMDELYHPLVENPVCNTLKLENNCILTGSNASGKSTFIKAVAINSILAQSINTCTAREMILPKTRIITSMAIRDDIIAGESYYIKEIKYLNRIVQSMSNDRMVICVIDEILRGTNTQERIAASTAVLKYLSEKNCLAIVASHDIELTRILSNKYKNFHFREQILDKDIVFDYKIHEGASTSKNAIRLLEYVGLPKEIIEEARKVCEKGA